MLTSVLSTGARAAMGLDTFWHQRGLSKNGARSLSVGNGQLKVYGVDALLIADGSIMARVFAGLSGY